MTISIAMCTYNGAPHLATQMESFVQQTLLPDELVICDDGSTDATLEVIEGFRRSAPFAVRVFRNEQNLGYAKNFERAIELCTGDLIALSDQDDVWYSQKLATLAALFEADAELGGVFSNIDVLDPELRPTGRTLWRSIGFTPGEQAAFRRGRATDVLFRKNVVTGMALIFRSELRDKLLPIPQGWSHDAWLAFMLVLHASLHPHPGRLVGYRTHLGQQVGPPASVPEKILRSARLGIPAFLERARLNNLVEYEKAASQFEALTTYLQGAAVPGRRELLERAAAKVRHARAAKAFLSGTRRSRLTGLVNRVAEYRSYSPLGLQGMFRDLIL